MKWIFKQDEQNVRYIECLYLPSMWFDKCFLKQRKTWWGWKTTAWCYSYILAPRGMDYVIRWLDWCESYTAPSKTNTLRKLTEKNNDAKKTI